MSNTSDRIDALIKGWMAVSFDAEVESCFGFSTRIKSRKSFQSISLFRSLDIKVQNNVIVAIKNSLNNVINDPVVLADYDKWNAFRKEYRECFEKNKFDESVQRRELMVPRSSDIRAALKRFSSNYKMSFYSGGGTSTCVEGFSDCKVVLCFDTATRFNCAFAFDFLFDFENKSITSRRESIPTMLGGFGGDRFDMLSMANLDQCLDDLLFYSRLMMDYFNTCDADHVRNVWLEKWGNR